jgi:hypothetical protein
MTPRIIPLALSVCLFGSLNLNAASPPTPPAASPPSPPAGPPAVGPDAVYPPSNGINLITGQPTPLMGLLDQTGVGHSLEAANIRLFGHVEGSYTYNFENPAMDLNAGRVFDSKTGGTVNQVDFNVERPIDLSKNRWDIGGRVELLYGSDAAFTEANGLLDHQSGPYQFDIPQLYFDTAVPLGNGVRVRAGKFLFFKQIDPNASVFYSHSYAFGAALPYTLTGITGMYPITKELSIEGGISRGWDQSLKDNNSAIDGIFRVRDDINDRLSLTLTGTVGPELPNDDSNYREAVDFTANFAATQQLTFLVDAVFATQARSGTNSANWYGVSGYAVYQFNDYVAAAVRLEWYADPEGFTTAVSQTLYEATIGLTITPFPPDALGSNLKIRPEFRADYSTADFFDGLTRHDQYTLAVDAIFNF